MTADLPEAAGAVPPVSISSPSTQAPSPKYKASIYENAPVSAPLGKLVSELELALGMEIWLLVQNGEDEWSDINENVYCGFRDARGVIQKDARIALLIHSPGGQASSAYKIIRLFQRRTSEFFTIVPLLAKSAATLMAVGGKEIVMGPDAELGPLDVQLYDADKDEWDSALNAVQSLERLNAYALSAFDQAMFLFLARTRKKPDFLLPHALNYAIAMIRPLVEKIDTIELTRRSRELKVAEDYAVRLMRAHYPHKDCLRIASNLVEKYSTHEFVIDRAEAARDGPTGGRPPALGMRIMQENSEVERVLSEMAQYLEGCTVIGRISEVSP